ncbi:MAG: hypothetical protein K2M08_00810, partial [Anaeroplasmataceae bacterium]|nr:hypothetical protein [Anaeroplasmataceae bacterium]
MELIYWIVGAILVIAIAISVFIIINNRKIQKRKNDIIKLFTNACKEKGIENFKIEYVKKDTHDFYFEDEKNIYYIKIIYNFSHHEICITNPIQWLLRKLSDHNET